MAKLYAVARVIEASAVNESRYAREPFARIAQAIDLASEMDGR